MVAQSINFSGSKYFLLKDRHPHQEDFSITQNPGAVTTTLSVSNQQHGAGAKLAPRSIANFDFSNSR